ncbi:MAG: hypothetical protein A2X35_04020 [Elusimicrobia bacterium GWA2_61_42]|nr:MAG: hypothetical protein A2X35_04020 [Elusimicrobia bacterium GWA2_61_42]OGR74425.1 MAG: hypothetical protein A2X38_00795 [Elusimicrobia bacterium GWC2_61_25]
MASRQTKEFFQSEAAVWLADGIIEQGTYDTLREKYSFTEFGFAGILRYIGIIGGLLAFFGLVGAIAALTGSAFVGALATGGIGYAAVKWGLRLTEDLQERYATSSKIVVTLGVYLLGASVGILCGTMGMKAGAAMNAALTVGLPIACYLAYQSRNAYLLLLALLTLFHWIGSWDGMLGRSTYAFGVQDPRLMWPVALAAVGIGVYHEQHLYPETGRFYKVWQAVGLIYFNLSLLILSSFSGKDGYPADWVILFTLGCIAQIIAADRLQNGLIRGFGVTFLCINIFTRYHELFWKSMQAGIFLLAGGAGLLAFSGLLYYYLKYVSVERSAS